MGIAWKGVIVKGVEQWLDAKAVARREHQPVGFIPDDERELAAQAMQALRSQIFIEVQGDLAIRARAQPVS
jgi:hypothetical protein